MAANYRNGQDERSQFTPCRLAPPFQQQNNAVFEGEPGKTEAKPPPLPPGALAVGETFIDNLSAHMRQKIVAAFAKGQAQKGTTSCFVPLPD